MLLTGRTGTQLVYQNATSMRISPAETEYVRRLGKITDEYMNSDITCERNIRMYDRLAEIYSTTVFSKRPMNFVPVFESGRKIFCGLSERDQAAVLLQLFKVSQIGTSNADLTKIAVKSKGTLQTNKYLKNFKEIKLIDQSPSGLRTKETDLLTV